jgi:hypothetical protein
MWDDLHFGFSDLGLLSEHNDRKEYFCGCYHKKSRRADVWSFIPVCKKHKAEVRKRFKALPWYKKAGSYIFFLFSSSPSVLPHFL